MSTFEVGLGECCMVSAGDVGQVDFGFGRVNWQGVGGLAARAFERIRDLLKDIDLSGMTKDEFLAKVAGLYDSMIAPAILGLGPWGFALNPIVRAIVMGMASRFYDNHS